MRYLMTQSLLSSWLYQFATGEDYVEQAKADFMAVLRQERRPPSDAMKKGIEFEDLVFSACDGMIDQDHPWRDQAEAIARYVVDGQRQLAASKDIEIDGMKLLLYGKLDCLKAGTIYDIKFSSSYEVGKYIKSPQHAMYFELVPEAWKFIYLISNGRNSWKEEYRPDEITPVVPLIRDFLNHLKINGLMATYQAHWKTKY